MNLFGLLICIAQILVVLFYMTLIADEKRLRIKTKNKYAEALKDALESREHLAKAKVFLEGAEALNDRVKIELAEAKFLNDKVHCEYNQSLNW